MQIFSTILQSGAFATPLPWQAEISFLTLAVLLFGTPRVIDSIRRFREAEYEHDDEHALESEQKVPYQQDQPSSHEHNQAHDAEDC
jgi:ABC-type nickel/cobalt efflux system permease component RcnA